MSYDLSEIRGEWFSSGHGGFFLHGSDVLPGDRLGELGAAVVSVLGRPGEIGRPKQSHGLIADLAELFLIFDREGIPRPTRGLQKVHNLDGRIVEIFRKHGVGVAYVKDGLPVHRLITVRLRDAMRRLQRLTQLGKKEQTRLFTKAENQGLKTPEALKDVRRYFEFANQVADQWRKIGAG